MHTLDLLINSIIADILKAEGGYVYDPADRGGETMYGITLQVARMNGYTGPMQDMPRAVAEAIYRKRYVEEPKFDRVGALAPLIGAELVEAGVNQGPGRPAEALQRWLNAFNDRRAWDDLFVDSRIGPATLTALAKYLTVRSGDGERVMLMALNCSQGSRYLQIVENDTTQRRFAYGWMLQRVANILPKGAPQ